MKQLCLGLLATLIVLPFACQARPNQEGAYEVLGVGTIACEVWTKDRADKGSDRNFINGAWLQGYLTAVNVFGDGPSHLAKGTDAEAIMTWIDNYCAQHPGDRTNCTELERSMNAGASASNPPASGLDHRI